MGDERERRKRQKGGEREQGTEEMRKGGRKGAVVECGTLDMSDGCVDTETRNKNQPLPPRAHRHTQKTHEGTRGVF